MAAQNLNNKNPYQSLDSRSFYRPAVSSRSMFDIDGLWNPKFNLEPSDPVSTFGSCFAQHIGRSLRDRKYNWHISEKPPAGMPKPVKEKFGYDVFSSRTGNIYTTSLLRQWVYWAADVEEVPNIYWKNGDRYFDPFRPAIEPDGFSSLEEMISLRNHTIRSFFNCIKDSKFFVFTMGLTESWFDTDGFEYPMCPGTAAGVYDPGRHKFKNQDYSSVQENLVSAMAMMRSINPDLKFILTVSPVPLTATMSGNHVLVATMESKSILRSVAGKIKNDNSYCDYFPSYEIINSPVFRGSFFEPNQRNVNPFGVQFVMNMFFKCLGAEPSAPHNEPSRKANAGVASEYFDPACEEAMLEAYSEGET